VSGQREHGWASGARTVAIASVVSLFIGLVWVNTIAAQYCWLLIAAAPWAADRRAARHAGPADGPPDEEVQGQWRGPGRSFGTWRCGRDARRIARRMTEVKGSLAARSRS
jgi:hypothetical protein